MRIVRRITYIYLYLMRYKKVGFGARPNIIKMGDKRSGSRYLHRPGKKAIYEKCIPILN